MSHWNIPKKTTAPEFVELMKAEPAEKVGVEMGDERFIGEPKMDGQRGQIHINQYKGLAAVYCGEGTDITDAPGVAWMNSDRSLGFWSSHPGHRMRMHR